MHGYSIYHPLARRPLDPDYVPFTARPDRDARRPAGAVRGVRRQHAVARRPEPLEPTSPTGTAATRKVFFASEDDAAEYYAGVLPRLQRMGCLGAFAWCFPDYHPKPVGPPAVRLPAVRAVLRPVPAGRVDQADGQGRGGLRAGARRSVRPERTVPLPVPPDEYYRDPGKHLRAMYERFGRALKILPAAR